jgi:ribose 1,5-bisphosphokinase PhnN
MLNVCQNCGEYRSDKTIDPSGPFAICPLCRYKHLFRHLPLVIVCGPSAAGKSTVCNQLVGKIEDVVLLDADILWRPEFNTPDNQYRDFFETWLRLGKNIGQSGRPLVLFNSGAIPENVEPCVERRYFTKIYYLALVCDEETLIQRLKQRPSWRQTSNEKFIQEQLAFNRWFREQSAETTPQIQLLNTTNTPIETTINQVKTWIRNSLNKENGT